MEEGESTDTDEENRNTDMDTQDHPLQEQRTTFEILYSQAQNSKRKRNESDTLNYSDVYTDTDDSDYRTPQPKRKYSEINTTKLPNIVIINSQETKLAKINPIKMAKILHTIGKDSIKTVTKNSYGGITVVCYTPAQAQKIKMLTHLDKWAVSCSYPKSQTESKGVISGISHEVTDEEIIEIGKNQGIINATRIMQKRNGLLTKSMSICLTFKTPNLPSKIQIGYEIFSVKPYIPPIIRCFNCQRLGHVAGNCRSKTRCVRCGEQHSFQDCTKKDQVKCCRCGENHSSAYEGCNSFKQERQIQKIKITQNISYAEATKVAKSSIPEQRTPNHTQNTSRNETPYNEEKKTQQPKETSIAKDANPPDNPPQRKARTKETATQTEQKTTATQTEIPSPDIYKEHQLIELLTGAMQIWDTIKSKEDRTNAIKTLVQHILHSEEAQPPKHKQSKHRTPSKSPSNRKKSPPAKKQTQEVTEPPNTPKRNTNQKPKRTVNPTDSQAC